MAYIHGGFEFLEPRNQSSHGVFKELKVIELAGSDFAWRKGGRNESTKLMEVEAKLVELVMRRQKNGKEADKRKFFLVKFSLLFHYYTQLEIGKMTTD